ncbi:uncharacterized protein LOC115443291 [Manduca sexta]|uniref:Uncharacterized protein n=1 Tax=Manduca sexta TaxID=7130 RepID=A0A921Z2H6_MANSE|nr:uncharacterized protein LOC115443291 [Manduca sexta]KAG6449783.1 hypothetical protein O3G_MSEX006232 [Manduca sexta]
MARQICYFFVFTLLLSVMPCEMKRVKVRDYPTDKQLTLQRKETTPVDFTRLVVMRLVYGLAKVLGFEEPVSEVLNGALVPPGVDDDDDFDDDDDDGIFDDY